MDDPLKQIAVVQAAPSAVVQDIFRMLLDRWRPFVRVAGVIAEGHGLADRACNAGFLRNIGTGEQFPIFQDLGPGSTGCHLEADGVLRAGAAAQRDIAAGCDLVLLSKFGKLEAGGGGLLDAFGTAVEAHLPILTSVSPALEAAWAKFAAPLFTALPADPDQIDAWWRTVRSRTAVTNRGSKVAVSFSGIASGPRPRVHLER
ncbi:MAG TPA: DUF2478 domain-containing protein [Stellaceae bacterium]|jgi:hypothetical protein|nr:DUF2478 domain-containing protein [Stellaceae bacterium]